MSEENSNTEVIIRKGNEEIRLRGNKGVIAQTVLFDSLNLDLFKKPKKANFLLITLLVLIYIGLLLFYPDQNGRFIFGSVISVIIALYLYHIFRERFSAILIVILGILLSSVASNRLSFDSFIKIISEVKARL
jgi:hypothetical protein